MSSDHCNALPVTEGGRVLCWGRTEEGVPTLPCELPEGFPEETTFELGLIKQAVFELSQAGSPLQAGGTM